MEQLRRAGVDLREPDTVQAVIQRFDSLVARLERELAALGVLPAAEGRPGGVSGARETW